MKDFVVRAFCTLCSLVLGGCMSADLWYEPHAATGKIEGPFPDRTSPPTAIVFSAPSCGWVKLRISGSQSDIQDYRWAPTISIKLYKDIPYIHDLTDTERDRRTAMRNQHFHFVFDSPTVVVTPDKGAPQTFILKLPYGGKTDFIFSYQDWVDGFQIAGNRLKYFDVDFPSMTIDGTRFEIPKIHFTRETGILVHGPLAMVAAGENKKSTPELQDCSAK